MKLGVNIDHVATIRQARRTPYPELTRAAREAERGGADFITVHLREDRRHITDADLPALAAAVKTFVNLEIAATEEMRAAALSFAPPKICLVPERRAELTTEGGLDARARVSFLRDFIAPFAAAGMETALFVDPDESQIRAAAEIGARAVELHTGEYAAAGDARPLHRAAEIAAAAGLRVHAGHGLRLDNVAAVAAVPEISELNIGHAIVARALFVGLREAVREMADAVKK
ncbi:MAG: pyridoxine 5'-phosphate synthase [Gammaproteobacteria bacterium]